MGSQCHISPSSTKHLFECISHPIDLSTRDLWDKPGDTARFRSGFGALDFLPATFLFPPASCLLSPLFLTLFLSAPFFSHSSPSSSLFSASLFSFLRYSRLTLYNSNNYNDENEYDIIHFSLTLTLFFERRAKNLKI